MEARQEVRRLLLKETSDVRGCQASRFLQRTIILEQEMLLCRARGLLAAPLGTAAMGTALWALFGEVA